MVFMACTLLQTLQAKQGLNAVDKVSGEAEGPLSLPRAGFNFAIAEAHVRVLRLVMALKGVPRYQRTYT